MSEFIRTYQQCNEAFGLWHSIRSHLVRSGIPSRLNARIVKERTRAQDERKSFIADRMGLRTSHLHNITMYNGPFDNHTLHNAKDYPNDRTIMFDIPIALLHRATRLLE